MEKPEFFKSRHSGRGIFSELVPESEMKFLYKILIRLMILMVSFVVVLHGKGNTGTNPWVSITRCGFVKEGAPFKFIGANAVSLVFYDDWDLDIEKAIRTAKENNISVLRFYIDLGWGKDDDFDRIFDIASKYGVYVILVFTDCCCSSDYPALDKYFEVHAPFCNITNKYSVKAFKKLIKQIIERKNSINGKLYRDDPTILAWEIANELEYWRFNKSDVHNWIKEIATYIKSLDKNHLVTIGISSDDPEFNKNSLIYEIFNVPALDFFSFHLYPSSEIVESNNLMVSDKDIQKIEFITKGFLSLGKPVILEELGFSNSVDLNLKVRSNKDTMELYASAFKKYMDKAFSLGCSGVMFWGWGVPDERRVPMWWSDESHSVEDNFFCKFLKQYRISMGEE